MCLKLPSTLLLILCLPRVQYNPTGLESSSLSYLQFSLFFFLCSFNHLPPSALFCFQPPQPHSLASLTSLLPLFLRHLLYHQTEVIRSTSWISMARFSIFFFFLPPNLAAFNSFDLWRSGKDLLGSFLNQGNSSRSAYWSPCCVHSLTRWAQITQTPFP